MGFYKQTLVFEVLAEDLSDLPGGDPDKLAYAIMFGGCSGVCISSSVEEVDAQTMARLLISQGSDPGFFQGLGAGGEDEK